MTSFRHRDERRPPEPKRASDVAVTRFDGIFEVDPGLMTEHVRQQEIPNWDTLRIAAGRHDHLDWMHRHWAGIVVSGEDLLANAADGPGDPPATV